MSSEGAKPGSSSMKKGFCAPVIKGSGEVNQTSEKKAEVKPKKDVSVTQQQRRTKKGDGQYPKNKLTEKKEEPRKKESKEKSTLNASEKPRETKTKPQTPLTDSQYEDIFQSVLQQDPPKQNSMSEENSLKIVHDETENNCSYKINENSPSNCEIGNFYSVKEEKNTPSYDLKGVGLKRPVPEEGMKTPPAAKRSKPQTEASPWGSHFNKKLSQASSIIKEMVESQSSLMNSSVLLNPDSSSDDGEGEGEGCLSQRQSQRSLNKPDFHPEDQRTRLENLQRLRDVGLWKQRYLADVTDPQDVPEIWYCHMNPDEKYNSCLKEEQQLSADEEADMIFNEFTAGSVVWARVAGYPWWPAMVDDDPDLEQFYWLEEDDVTVTYYHVVFFDEVEVTRAWVPLKDIVSFSKNENKYKQKSAMGINYSRRLIVSKEQAKAALLINTSQRLRAYSFIARYKGNIATSAKKAEETKAKYNLKVTPKNVTKYTRAKSQKEKVASKVQEKQVTIKPKKPKLEKVERVKKEEKVEEYLLSDKSAGENKKNETTISKRSMFDEYALRKSQKNAEDAVKKAPKQRLQNLKPDLIDQSNDVESKVKTSKTTDDGERQPQLEDSNTMFEEECPQLGHSNMMIDGEKQPRVEVSNKMLEEIPRLEFTNTVFDGEKEPKVRVSDETFAGKKEPQVENSKMFKREKDTLQESILMFDSDTPSIDENLSQKSKVSESRIDESFSQKSKMSDSSMKLLHMPELALGSLIEPMECQLVVPPNSRELSPECNSQGTIANYLAQESEDAVVPDDSVYSQLSEPFEE